MKRAVFSLCALTALTLVQVSASLAPAGAQVTSVPALMNFQGRLAKPDGSPVPDGTYSVRFSLWTALTGGTEKWNQTQNVAVRNGVFAVPLSTFPAGLFNANLFLEIKVGSNAPLTPRQPLVSVAYAMKADSVKDGGVTGASIANGAITANKFASGLFNTTAWLLTGNSGTDPAAHFLGTTDSQPLNFRANNLQAFRLEYAQTDIYTGNNVIGGYWNNAVTPGVVGATVFGGLSFSSSDNINRVTEHGGTVSGGFNNRAGNDNADPRDANGATVAGGYNNTASNSYSFVGAGYSNTASGFQSVVAGGINNIASGASSMVLGGGGNTAAGQASFAAGTGAQALHAGAFVWADSLGFNTASTAPNQFIIRAFGGVGINTASPQAPLHVKGILGGILNLEGTDHGYIQFFPRGVNTGRKAYIGFPFGGSHTLEIANEDGGAVRVIGTFVNNSDARYKTNVASIENALESVLGLRGVSYDWRKDLPGQSFPAQRQIGFIAQEVEKVLPDLVYTDEKGYKSVAYVNAVPVLVEAVKTLNAKVETQQAQIMEMKRQNARIAELEAKLNALLNRPR